MSTREYTHVAPGQEVEAIAGHYIVDQELRLTVGTREVLVILGQAMWDKSCCGMGGCRYAVVPGYILRYKIKTGTQGQPVSEIETINDPHIQAEIARQIKNREFVQQVNFW